MPGYGGYRGFEGGYFDPEFFIGLFLLIGVILVICAAFSVAMYILRSVALYRLAARRGLRNPGLAWLPAVGLYRAGTIADDINAREGSRTYFGRMILGGYIFSQVVSYLISGAMLRAIVSSVNQWQYWGDPGNWYGYGSPFTAFGWFNPITNLFNSIAGLVGLAAYVLLIISLHRIYKAYRPQSATLWTVLSVLLPFLQAFFLFAIRNAEPVPEWREYYPPGPPPPPPYGPVYPPPWQPGPPAEGPPQNTGYPEQ
jgi:UDP-N-acetylmuramyl pentapeptide phosphotransferase/UDP-N-acetylglucosamine-1-phosphate transferase